jgi:hypothetical protein
MTTSLPVMGGPQRLALLIGAALSFTAGQTFPWGVVLAVLLLVVLAVDLRWPAGTLAIVVLAGAGALLRVQAYGVGFSDALDVTVAAIDRVLAGGNPYGIGYAETTPPGAPFPYGPVSLLWYLPFRDDPRRFEFLVSLATIALLAVRGRALGLALYATFPPLLTLASDGANDTSAGLLLLAALVAIHRVGPMGGVLLAAAAAFKPFALAWLPGLVVAGGIANLLGFLAMSGLVWLPLLLIWGAGPMLTSLAMAEEVHRSPYYSLAWALEVFTGRPQSKGLFEGLRLVLGGATALLTAPFVRTSTGILVSGLLIYLVTLYTGYWSTFAYLAAIAPVVAWYVDGWLGLAEGRIAWPGDPVGRLSAEVDRRWPLREPARAEAQP